MKNAAEQLIEKIKSNGDNMSWADIKNVLEDGEALMHLGVTDEDQETVEEAHAICCEGIAA